jgi:hypothetical protein
MDTPRTEETTAGVRHSAGVVTLVADAVWARGRRLLRSFDENYPDLDSPNPGSANRPRPDRTLGRVLVRESRGNSWYRALQLGVDTQPWHGHTFAFAYTLAQAERDTEDWDFLPQDQRNYGAERGPSASDARHRVSASASLFLPGRFRLATLLAVQSALPYNLTVGADVNGDLESTTDRPPGVSRNSARGDDLWQIDVRLSRYFRVAGLRVAGLAEAFNVFNHRNWVGFDGKQNNATFGNPTGAAPAREIQLGIKVDF